MLPLSLRDPGGRGIQPLASVRMANRNMGSGQVSDHTHIPHCPLKTLKEIPQSSNRVCTEPSAAPPTFAKRT